MNIYVSNLNYKVTDEDLMQLFESYGEISSARVITDRFTGRSRGFGFVEMPDEEAAQKAIEELNQFEHEGKTLSVNEAQPREERPRREFGGGDRRGGGGYGNRDRDRDRDRGQRRW